MIKKYCDNEELYRLLIAHSRCVAEKAVATAYACGLSEKADMQFLVDAAMLHDIGVGQCDAPAIHCHGRLPYIRHGIAGAEILSKEGLPDAYARVCERHTGSGLTADEIAAERLPLPVRDLLPETLEEKLICYADKFYSKTGEVTREKSPERILRSMARHGEEALKRFMALHLMFGGGPRDFETNMS